MTIIPFPHYNYSYMTLYVPNYAHDHALIIYLCSDMLSHDQHGPIRAVHLLGGGGGGGGGAMT